MPNVIQPSFTSGELSPDLWGRTDINKYFSGLKTCRNFIPQISGGVSNRPGSMFIANVNNVGSSWRVIPFVYSVYQNYVLEFGKYYCRFYANDVQVTNAGVPVQLSTPYLDTDLPLLKYAQSANTLYLVHPNYAPQMITRTSPNSFTIQAVPFANGPFLPVNTDLTSTITPSATTGNITLTTSKSIFQSSHVGSLWQVTHYANGQIQSGTFGAVGYSAGNISVTANTGWSFITHQTWAGTISIEQSLDNGLTWITYRSYTGNSDYNALYSEIASVNCLFRIHCTAYTSGTISYNLTANPYYNYGIVQINSYTSGTSVGATVLTTLGGTIATSNWAEGAWSYYRGYPSCITFFQDRLTFGCTAYQPQTVWTSNTSDYYNFIINNPTLATDSVKSNLMSRQMNQINHLIPMPDLLAGTAGNLWAISPVNGIFSPGSISQTLQEYRGIANIPTPPFIIGKQMVYVQQAGSILRSTYWQYIKNGYDGDNLTLFSGHLFQNYTIVESAYQQNPNSTIWLVRSDGQLLSCTYMFDQQIVGWAHHDTNNGNDKYMSICTIPNVGFDEIWLVVKRQNGTNIERFVNRMASLEPEDQFFVDGGLVLNNPISITGVQVGVNPVVITAPNHGLTNGNYVDIDDIMWVPNTDSSDNVTQPAQLNEYQFIVANATTNTFTLLDPITKTNIDATKYNVYVSGGYVRQAFNSVSGLTQLAGQTVAILANGFSCPQQIVPSTGIINLQFYASRIAIGIPIVSDFETLNIDSQTQEGSMIPQKVKIPSATIFFRQSRGGWVGPDTSNLSEIVQRSTESLGQPIQLRNDEELVDLRSGYYVGSRIFFRQIDPLPVTILAVIPNVQDGGTVE